MAAPTQMPHLPKEQDVKHWLGRHVQASRELIRWCLGSLSMAKTLCHGDGGSGANCGCGVGAKTPLSLRRGPCFSGVLQQRHQSSSSKAEFPFLGLAPIKRTHQTLWSTMASEQMDFAHDVVCLCSPTCGSWLADTAEEALFWVD